MSMRVSLYKVIFFYVLVFAAGGLFSLFLIKNAYFLFADENVQTTEWIKYYDELYGFEFEYPAWAVAFKHNIGRSFEIEPRSYMNLSFFVNYQEPPFQSLPTDLMNNPDPICMARFSVSVKDELFVDLQRGTIKADSLSSALEKAKSLFGNSEYITSHGILTDDVIGVRKNEPTLSLNKRITGAQDIIWFTRDPYVYTLSYGGITLEDTKNDEAYALCVSEQKKLFDKFVSGFRFTKID